MHKELERKRDKDLILKMDRWQEIINYLDMIAECIQVVLTAFGLYLAFGYLSQHAKKVRVEKSYSLVHGCMVKISKYVGQYHLFYKKVLSPKYKVILKDLTEVEAIEEIYSNQIKYKADMIEIDLLNFEIDAEIKLISDPEIKNYWIDFLNKKDAIESKLENLYKVKGDKEKSISYLCELPNGLLGDDHILSKEFLNSYRSLMSALLTHYRKQEDNLSFCKLFK